VGCLGILAFPYLFSGLEANYANSSCLLHILSPSVFEDCSG
jgi:hypothetical protein